MKDLLNKDVSASPNGYTSSRVRNLGTPFIDALVLLRQDGYVIFEVPHRLRQKVLLGLAVVKVQLENPYFL